jgi:hypothetical protein
VLGKFQLHSWAYYLTATALTGGFYFNLGNLWFTGKPSQWWNLEALSAETAGVILQQFLDLHAETSVKCVNTCKLCNLEKVVLSGELFTRKGIFLFQVMVESWNIIVF